MAFLLTDSHKTPKQAVLHDGLSGLKANVEDVDVHWELRGKAGPSGRRGRGPEFTGEEQGQRWPSEEILFLLSNNIPRNRCWARLGRRKTFS